MTDEQDAERMEHMTDEVEKVVRSEQKRGLKRYLLWGAVVALAVAGVVWWQWPDEKPISWTTQAVDTGDLVLTATATGNLEPKSEVTVGAEVSGLIDEVSVEENDRVTTGQVLARFDPEQLEIALEQARAQLETAEASAAQARATLEEAELTEKRKARLVADESAPQAELDAARASRKRAQAQLRSARASARRARSQVSDAKNRLDKAVITSPIDGVVLQRNVEPGNTVAASLQAPELFLLAEDLHEMELHVSLDEADVSLVEKGQSATFTVDAWPDREFPAEVMLVYLYPTIENNVVTYTTVLTVENEEGLLRPGMTATATVETGTRENALRVPNVALRFAPPNQEEESGGIFPGRPGGRDRDQRNGPSNSVWVLRDGAPAKIALRTGRTDGQFTEVLSDELAAGDEVIVGVENAEGSEERP